MNKNLIRGILTIFLLLLGTFLLIHSRNQTKLVSPIFGIPRIRFADNIWFPKNATEEAKRGPEVISAKAAFFVETKTGEVLYRKNPNQKMPIASLTKIMTVIVALENRTFFDQLRVSQRAADTEPDKMFLIAGEKLNIEELLEGIFLVSANDAAEVLAEGATGRREEFINLMNSKAVQLGMKDTHFMNPTGLEEDRRAQYSSAYDVALMARYAIYRWPHLTDISSKEHIFIPPTDTHQDYDLYTGINLLTTYPGVIGFKTGYTPNAGLTLVTLAKREGKEILGVILGSENRRDDARELLDYSFSKLGVKNQTISK